MKLSPEEYGRYWAGGLRMAAGVLLVILVHRGVQPLLDHPEWPAQGLGWIVLALAIVVGAFAVALGIARIVRTAVAVERGNQ